MSKLDDLINQLCPSGVKYKTFGDIVCFINGRAYKQEELLQEGKYKVLRVGNFFTNNSWYYSNLELEENKYCNKGDLLYAWAASLGPKIWDGDKTIFHYHIWKLEFDETIISKRYLYHFLRFDVDKMYKSLTQSTMPHVSMASMQKREIPVPPLEVQNEIVRILDKFTSLEAELEAELEARRKQYEYYRDSLLNFVDDSMSDGRQVEWKTLGEIATDIYRGSGIKRDQVTTEGIPCVRYGEIYTSYNIHFNNCISHTIIDNVPSPKYFEHGDILFAITGESVEDIAKSIAYMGNEKCLAGGDIVVLKHNQNPKYLSFALSTNNAIMQKGKGKVKSKVVHSSVPSISEIKIPVPDLETQEKIANILDNFLQLTNDITSGLPAEIEARKKQYEYYRDKLLTFKRKEA
jgi:type I restriction enzyme S subunit